MASDGAKLFLAAQTANDAKVKRLLKAKVDVDYGTTRLDITGVTALQAACGRGHLGVVRLLLKAKATLDLRDSIGAAALYHAGEQNQPACVQLLLEAQATVDLPADDGWRP